MSQKTVFISYRRQTGSTFAQLIDILKAR